MQPALDERLVVVRGELTNRDLTPEQRDLLEQGRAVMMPIERARLERVLVRHLRQGTSKYARSIPSEGIASVTLSLSGALWVMRAWPLLFLGLVIVFTVHGTGLAKSVGYVIVAIGVVLFLLGSARLIRAVRRRNEFRQNHS